MPNCARALDFLPAAAAAAVAIALVVVQVNFDAAAVDCLDRMLEAVCWLLSR